MNNNLKLNTISNLFQLLNLITFLYFINLPIYLLKKNALRQERASHKIFIRSNKTMEDENGDDSFFISVGKDKDEIEEIITSCLEKPLHLMLQKWLGHLKRECFRENASDVIAEIEAIRNKLLPTNRKTTDVPSIRTGTIVPDNMKDYLFG